MKDLQAEGSKNNEVILGKKKKKGLLLKAEFSLGVYQADYLIRADQAIPY